jgi:hypothetical protein
MNLEKIPQENNKTIILRQFGFRGEDDFRQAVEKTLESSEKTKGYVPGTGGFLRMVAGSRELSPKEFGQLNHLIKQEIKDIQKRQKDSQINTDGSAGSITLKEAEDLRMIRESEELEEKERQRLYGEESDEELTV